MYRERGGRYVQRGAILAEDGRRLIAKHILVAVRIALIEQLGCPHCPTTFLDLTVNIPLWSL